jgi:hypothetical protein
MKGADMDGFTASAGAISNAAHGVGVLASRVHELHRSTDDVVRSLSGTHPWGLLRTLRQDFLSLAAEFKQHLDHMSGAIDGAKQRLNDTATNYSAAERACVEALATTGNQHDSEQGVRQLNPASRFYQEHRTWNGVITAGFSPFGQLGSAALHSWRLVGDLTSDDKYNIGPDIANLVTDASVALLSVRADYNFFRADPLGYLVRNGLGFLLNAFYWTKSIADRLTGDPIAIGQAAYGFDSVAEGCRKLAADLGETLQQTLCETWRGSAADIARQRLTGLRDGIAHTGGSADNIAALLQLVTSLITDVESIVRGMITDLITWAVVTWISAQLLGAETFGVSEVAAAERITAESARTAGTVGRVLTWLTVILRRISRLIGRLRAELRHTKEKSFAALLRSSPGKKFVDSNYGGARYNMKIVREDAAYGKHERIDNVHLRISVGKQSWRAAKNSTFHQFGFHQFRTDPAGEPYPGGKRKIRILSYQTADGKGGVRGLANPAGVAGSSASTVLPVGRSVQYWLRAGHVPPRKDIDQELGLWAAP